MYSLPLPHSGHISAILHFSDIHIRTGDVERSRFNDFIQVFDNLERIIVSFPQTLSEEIVAVCTGDCFHYKNKLDSLSVRLFNILIDKITKHMPLYIIQGNHDHYYIVITIRCYLILIIPVTISQVMSDLV